MMKVKYYTCPECKKKYKTLSGWGEHVDTIHPGLRPEGYSVSRFFYYAKTRKTAGKCKTCGKPTPWNENSMKYDQYCTNPECKKAYAKIAKQRMIDKYGKEHILDDPEQQRKMLKGRRISGTYTFSNGVKFDYVGKYEKNFLEMLDKLLDWHINDLFAPSPHTYYYDFKESGKIERKFYIPDFYIPSLNLEIEIKQQTSTNDAYNKQNKPKEHMKDEIMRNNQGVNYLKINDNDFAPFFQFLMNYQEIDPGKKETGSIVTDGASGTSNGNGASNPAVRNARQSQIEWEKQNGFDPNEDWIKDGMFRATEGSTQYYDDALSYEIKKPTEKDIVTVLKSLTDTDLSHIEIDRDKFHEYASIYVNNAIAVYHDKEPIGFLTIDRFRDGEINQYNDMAKQILYEKGDVTILVAINPKYQHCGYGRILATQGLYELTKNKKVNRLWWEPSHIISENAAKSYHFNRINHPWYKYGRFYTNKNELKSELNSATEGYFANTFIGRYYRLTYNGVGIYDAYKSKLTPDQWKKFLSRRAAKWLKKPDIEYNENYASYFTQDGYDRFMKITFPLMKKVLIDKEALRTEVVEDIPYKYEMVYNDDDQVVVDLSKPNTTEDVSVKEAFYIGNELPKVYFTSDLTPGSVLRLFETIGKELPGNVAVKLHSGEPGNQNFLKPEFWKPVIDRVGGTVVECNTAYQSERDTTEKHQKVIHDHGWDKYFSVDIMDASGEEELPVRNGHVLDVNIVGDHLKNYDSMLVLSHFKGHAMGGYGGALKNISIGIASKNGKKAIHRVKPNQTVGLGIKVNQNEFLAAMSDAASSIVEHFDGKMIFINAMINLSVDCDCASDAHAPCMKDIGILASTDPVALDKACLDLIHQSADPGKEEMLRRIQSRNGEKLIDYASEIHVGNHQYELVQVNTSAMESATEITERWVVYQKNGIEHTCIRLNNDPDIYRAKSELMIIKNDELLINFKSDGDYSFPGGTWNNGEDPMSAAIREAQEEVRMNVKNVKYGGTRIWKYRKAAKWMIEEIRKEEQWNSCYCTIYIGEYDGSYIGYVDTKDRDDIIDTAKFMKIKDIYHILKPEHKKALSSYYNYIPTDNDEAKAIESSYYSDCECFGSCGQMNEEKMTCMDCPHNILQDADALNHPLDRAEIITILSQIPYPPDQYCVRGEAGLVLHGILENTKKIIIALSPDAMNCIRRDKYKFDKCIKALMYSDYDRDSEYIDGFQVMSSKELLSQLKDSDNPDIVDYIRDIELYGETKIEVSGAEEVFGFIPRVGKVVKTPNDLSKWMKKHIRYKDFTVLMSHDEVLRERKGSCHDQVMFELQELREIGIEPRALFFIEYNDEGNGTNAMTHTLVYYVKDWKLYWFENAWTAKAGIHKFSNPVELRKEIIRLHNKGEWGVKEDYPKVAFFEFHEKLHTAGESLYDFVNICTREEGNDLILPSAEPAMEEAQYSEKNCYPVFIILQHSGTAMANVIKKFTRDDYSHACISFNSKLSPLYSFGNKNGGIPGQKADAGFVMQDGPFINFYRQFKSSYSVYVMYVDKTAYAMMVERLQYFIEHVDELKYDFLNLISVYFKRSSERSRKYFCSRFVMEIINAGNPSPLAPSLYKPQDITTLDNITLVNRGTDFRKYNFKITEANLKKVREGRFSDIVVESASLTPMVKEEMSIATEGLFSFIKKNPFSLKAWKDILFPEKDLLGSGYMKNLYTGVKIKDGKIEIHGINYNLLLSRIKKQYEDKVIYNIFVPKYNAMSYKKFERKKIQRAEIKIDYLYTEEFFALELATLFTDLGKRFRDKAYKNMAKQIYDGSWLSVADKNAEITPTLDTTNLKNLRLELNSYQKEFIELYPKLKAQLNLKGYILAFEQGLGKTLTAIALSECLEADHVYIVCPNSLKENWALEIQKYYARYDDEDTWRSEVFICSDKPLYFNEHTTKFMIINNESIQKMYPYVMGGKNMLILDESHNFRNVDSKRVQQLLSLRDMLKCTDSLIMSGTPIKATPSEIVPALLMIDPTFTMDAATIFTKTFKLHSTLGTSLVQTRFGKIIYRKEKDVLDGKLPNKYVESMSVSIHNGNRYTMESVTDDVFARFHEIYDSGYEEFIKLKDPFNQYSRRYAPKDIDINRFLDIINVLVRKKREHVHEIDIIYSEDCLKRIKANIPNKKDKDYYDYLIKNYVRYFNHCLGVAFGEILPLYRRDMYIAMYDENMKKFHDMINKNPKKTLIFSQFKGVVTHIYRSLNEEGIGAVMITGDVTNRMEILKEFKENPSISVLVATSQTIGTGVTLTEANQMFFFGPPWRDSDFAQCSDRIHRIGQTDDCYIYSVLLDTGADLNLSTRMDNILSWSRQMTSSVITTTKDDQNIDQTEFDKAIQNSIITQESLL